MRFLYLKAFVYMGLVLIASCKSTTEFDEWSDQEAMARALEWQEKNPVFSSSPTDWTNGAYYTGVFRAHQATQNDIYLTALVNMANRNHWKASDRFYHADDLSICSSYLYLDASKYDGVNLQATEQIVQDHLYKPYRWKDGNTNTNQPVLWWWCDALFMAPPALTMYSKYKGDTTYLNKMNSYYLESYNLLYDKEERLFARDLRFISEGDGADLMDENGKKIFWSRGNGWVLGGLALILDYMPQDFANRPFYVNLYKTMAQRIVELQCKDGLWKTSLLSPKLYNHGEVSGTALFTFALAWGINNGLLDEQLYLPSVRKAWKALRASQKNDGMIGWVQNIGDSPEPAGSESWQNYGTGAFLLAGSEVLKLAHSGDSRVASN